MNKNISSELAVGLILLIAVLIGSIFWMMNKKETLENQYASRATSAYSNSNNNNKENISISENVQKNSVGTTCQPHYYDGVAEVSGWLADKNNNAKELNLEIKSDDINKLPVTNNDSLNIPFKATLIDPTQQVKDDLQNSSSENPALITIHGYAQNCQSFPQISLKQAGIAFKKG